MGVDQNNVVPHFRYARGGHFLQAALVLDRNPTHLVPALEAHFLGLLKHDSAKNYDSGLASFVEHLCRAVDDSGLADARNTDYDCAFIVFCQVEPPSRACACLPAL